MQFYPHRTVDEQAKRLPAELREAYKNTQLDRITLFDGKEEIELTGYAEYSYLDEKSYKTQPVRTQDGVIQEIDEYATFLTPRLIIKYNMMGIDDYRRLMKMLKKRNSFVVKCYDIVEDKIVKNEMYHATPSMPIIYQQYLTAFGIKEYAIELIGTNYKLEFEITHVAYDKRRYFATRFDKWKDFCHDNSENFFVNEDGRIIFTDYPEYSVHYRGNEVFSEDLIIDDALYYADRIGTLG